MAERIRTGPVREAKPSPWRTALWLLLIFALALFLRTYFNFEASVNDGNFLWSGTDGYYHERVVDVIQADGEFLQLDNMINYPIGAENPRPPLFVWTIAVLGGLLAPFFGGDVGTATGYVLAFAPAVWGAATIVPLYFLGKTAFGRRAGLWAALLLAITAAHMQRSNFGALDHDATILFFFVLAALCFVKALRSMDPDRVYVEDYRKGGIGAGFAAFFRENRLAVVYSLLGGVAFAAIALTWQGYPYVFAVFAVWYGLQLLVNHLRGRDSTGVFVIGVLPFLVTLAMIYPYYEAVGRTASFVYPLVYILVGVLVASLVFVPTRHLPPILVIPTIVGVALIGLILLTTVFKDIGDLFFSGLGYFVQSKLYTTIAEAQRTDLGFFVFSVGVVPFFFALAGMFFALASAIRTKRDDHLFLFAWAGVGLFMAFTASRFVFNATIAIALLAGWVMVRFVDWVRFGDVRRTWANVRMAGTGLVKSTRQAVGFRHTAGALAIAFLLFVPNLWLAVDAGIPQEYRSKEFADSEFFTQYTGALGQDFLSGSWIWTMDYLAAQDTDLPEEERPAFMAWWDYGFYAAQRGDHPTVADPFQFGYQVSGRFIASQSEQEAVLWAVVRLLEGERVRGTLQSPGFQYLAAQNGQDVAQKVWTSLGIQGSGERDYDEAYEAIRVALLRKDASGVPTESIPDDDKVVALYRGVRDATGKSIRYFTIDGRMFPCDDPNTPTFVDGNSIFYAPVFLADKNPDDYVKVFYTAGGQRYVQRLYETAADGSSRQITKPFAESSLKERFIIGGSSLYPMEADGDIDYNDQNAVQGIAIQGTGLAYEDKFYDSLFYKGWIGPRPQGGLTLPPFQEFAPGYGLKHFRLVSSTTNVQPGFPYLCLPGQSIGYHTGVQMLKYYDGASVTGRVVDHDGAGVSGAQVEARDNFGIMHDSGITDGDGRFRLVAPFSTENEPHKPSHQRQAGVYRGVGLNQIVVTVAGQPIAIKEFSVSDAQAMTGAEVALDEDIKLVPGDLKGFVFEDKNGNATFEPQNDTVLADATVTLEGKPSLMTGPDGGFSFTGVVPGSYRLNVTREGYEDMAMQVNVVSDSLVHRNVSMSKTPIMVDGNLTYEGAGVDGLDIVFAPTTATGQQAFGTSGAGGAFSVAITPGIYNLTVDHETVKDGKLYRYYTAEPHTFSVDEGATAVHLPDIVLARKEVQEPQGPPTAP